MNQVLHLIISNNLAFICFLLVIFYNIHIQKESILRISSVMSLLTVAAYSVLGCFDAAAASLFALLRNQICLKYPDQKKGLFVKVLILVVGTVFSAWCAYQRGGTWVAYLPAVSYLFCSCGYYLTKSASAMRIINAVDILLFWLVFDYLNLMVFNVATDLFVVTFPFVERYVRLDKTEST